MSNNREGSHARELGQRWAGSGVGVKKGSREKCRQGNAVAEKQLQNNRG
jgi:hypothetical protein